MRLIDADKLESLENLEYEYHPEHTGKPWYKAEDVWACIENQPTAVPGVPERWEPEEKPRLTAAEKIEAAGWECVVIFEDPSFDDALVGVTEEGRAVYDFEEMVSWLALNWDMSHDEAVEWIEYNTIGALPNAGPLGPLIMYSL